MKNCLELINNLGVEKNVFNASRCKRGFKGSTTSN